MKRLTRLFYIFFVTFGICIAQLNDRTDRQSNQSQSSSQSISTQLPSGKIIQDGPVDPKEYIVGPGDIFSVNIWATPPLNFQVPVTPEGSVVIPTVGENFLSGMTLYDAKNLVLSEIKKKYITGNASFTLYVPRQFNISISGMVLNEGGYIVQATQRVDALLQLANDIVVYKEKNITQDYSKFEEEAESKLSLISRRRIKVIRRNGTTVTADIEKFHATQNSIYNPLLRDGDVVIVPPANIGKDFIGVYGAVAKEGVYEFVTGDSLTTLLAIAGGLTAYADPVNVILTRNMPDGQQSEKRVNVGEIIAKRVPDIILQNGDRIIVGRVNSINRGGIVSIEGEIVRPGFYPIVQDSSSLSSIVERAGGFTPFALLNAAKVLRPSTELNNKTITYQYLRKGYTTSEDTAYLHNEILLKTKGDLVSTDFVELFEKKNKEKDIILRDGDKIIIPARVNAVYVFGEVKNPGHIPYAAGKDVNYYIQRAGGITEHGQDGEIRIVKSSSKQWLVPSETSIEEGDYIWIPKEPFRPFTYYLTVYSQVFGIIGTIATLILLMSR
ncbi:MAG: SLBB domain-containing protein [Ignavibacteriales bacterium]|nr:SLBB domain-containing protein [Ignavibacteriales bacterium]